MYLWSGLVSMVGTVDSTNTMLIKAISATIDAANLEDFLPPKYTNGTPKAGNRNTKSKLYITASAPV